MDLKRVGRFIAECRKSKNLTQEQLAEKLYITDRAVSKWERGLSLPDAGIMIDLCNILDINVNELLIGEMIENKDYKKKTEELLVEMARMDEEKNKRLIFDEFVLMIVSVIFYVSIVALASATLKEGTLLGIIVCISTVVLVVVAFYALKLETDAGYYECKKCGHRYVPKYWKAFIAPHMGLTRFLRCPECHKLSWSKKVFSKDKK